MTRIVNIDLENGERLQFIESERIEEFGGRPADDVKPGYLYIVDPDDTEYLVVKAVSQFDAEVDIFDSEAWLEFCRSGLGANPADVRKESNRPAA